MNDTQSPLQMIEYTPKLIDRYGQKHTQVKNLNCNIYKTKYEYEKKTHPTHDCNIA